MLQRGDAVPHFAVRDLDGRRIEYQTLWQQRGLVLVSVGGADPEGVRRYADALARIVPELTSLQTECIITADLVPGLGAPGVLVADRWGEVVSVADARSVGALPAPGELLDWARWVQMRCPECEGEAR